MRRAGRGFSRCVIMGCRVHSQKRQSVEAVLLGTAMACGLAGAGGCERKERVLDIEAPGLDVEVDKTGDGTLDVRVDERPD